MSVTNVIKGLMAVKGVKRADLAAALNMSVPALANKFTRATFSADDCIRVAEVLGAKLAFVDEQGQQIVSFSPDDAAPPRRSGQKATSVDTKNSDTKN